MEPEFNELQDTASIESHEEMRRRQLKELMIAYARYPRSVPIQNAIATIQKEIGVKQTVEYHDWEAELSEKMEVLVKEIEERRGR